MPSKLHTAAFAGALLLYPYGSACRDQAKPIQKSNGVIDALIQLALTKSTNKHRESLLIAVSFLTMLNDLR